MQTIVLYLCYTVLILLFSSAYNTSLIYCFVIWCLHTNKRRPCSSTLSGHPSSSFHMLQVYFQKNKDNYEWRVLEYAPCDPSQNPEYVLWLCTYVMSLGRGMSTFYHGTAVICLPSILMNGLHDAINSHNLIRTLRVRKFHRLAVVKDAGRHEFTHYATPTRRIDNTRLMHCDVLYPSMSCSVLEIRLAAVGESPWAPYIQAVLEVQTRVLIRNDVRHFCDMLILCLASLILGSAHVSRKRHGEGNQIIFSQSTDLKICRHDLKFRTFCIVSFPTSHKLLYCLKEKSLQRTFLGKT